MTATRIQRRRTKGWKMPEGARCCTRPTLLGNPWAGPDAVRAYRRFLTQVVNGVLSPGSIEEGLDVRRVFAKPIERWKELRGLLVPRQQLVYPMACFCGLDEACHVDVLVQYASRPRRYLLTDHQAVCFLKAMQRTGHATLTIEEVQETSLEVAAGTFEPGNTIAIGMAIAIDEAVKAGAQLKGTA